MPRVCRIISAGFLTDAHTAFATGSLCRCSWKRLLVLQEVTEETEKQEDLWNGRAHRSHCKGEITRELVPPEVPRPLFSLLASVQFNCHFKHRGKE